MNGNEMINPKALEEVRKDSLKARYGVEIDIYPLQRTDVKGGQAFPWYRIDWKINGEEFCAELEPILKRRNLCFGTGAMRDWPVKVKYELDDEAMDREVRKAIEQSKTMLKG